MLQSTCHVSAVMNMRMRFHTVLCVAAIVLLNLAGSFCQQDVCGRAPLNNKIVGGQDARAGSWPWQVSIHDTTTNSHFCGGSLISKDWVLSAAHCFQSVSPYNIMIYLGRHSQQGPNPYEISRTVNQIINHPLYNPNTNDNDMALLQLSSPVDFSDYIEPVCLAAAGSGIDQGLPSWVTGWGTMLAGYAVYPDILQEVEIPIVSNQECNTAYDGGITVNMLCAGVNNGGKDSCQGDSGGPLVSRQGPRWIQSGVVSFGNGCGDPRYPGVYARVSQYQDWINAQIGSDQPGFIEILNYDYYDIFSGSSPSLHLFPLSLTFFIISLIFCLFF